MAKGRVEIAPSIRHRVGNFENQRPVAGEAAGISDSARGWVVSEALGDSRCIDKQSQEATAVAAGVEHPLPCQVDFDGVGHRFPNETVLILHGLVLNGATPVGGAHAGTLCRLDASVPPNAVSSSGHLTTRQVSIFAAR